jgi:PelA/Pel-15E family pectate lyase
MLLRFVFVIGLSVVATARCAPVPPAQTGSVSEPAAPAAVAIAGFTDSAKHFQDANDDDSYPRHAEDRVSEIASNILLYQRDNGGWATNWDPRRILNEAEVAQVRADKSQQNTSFDNRTTYTQVEYLAGAFQLTRDERFRDGAVRGLEFTLKAQHASGGFPHSYPAGSEAYHHHITFMDDVMPGVLQMLRQAAHGAAPYDFLDDTWRARLADSLRRGDACVLKLQVVVDGTPTVWAGQYDSTTLLPADGRSFERASLVSDESVTVVEYLMRIEPPTPEVVRSIEAAARWFERSKIHGLRVEQVAAPQVRYKYHTSTHDLRVVEDPTAPPLWARFYEIPTNRPFMANRDGIKVYSLDQVERERRTGYRWYGDFATGLLEKDYPEWRRRRASREVR